MFDPKLKTRRRRKRFSDEDLACRQRWRLCRAFKCLPLPGALAEQNPWDMARFEILEAAEQKAEREREIERLALMLGVQLR